MRPPVALLAALLLAAPACAEPLIGARPQPADDGFLSDPPGVQVSTFAENLDSPWSLVFLPDGRVLVAERPGRIRLVENGLVRPEPVALIESVQGGEAGLMGLALHPRFPTVPYLYAMHTYRDPSGSVTNRVIRLVLQGDHARFDRVIVGGIPGGRVHDGGRIAFGPDGNLYIGTGEIFQAQLAQNMQSLGGKLLRVTPDGGIPADNPFPGSPVYTFGHRNIQGLAWEPRTEQLFVAEHGPSGELGVRAWDEVNVITPGRNYGWPRVVGAVRDPAYVDPIVAWPDSSVPPSGMAFWNGDLYVATLRSQALVRIHVEKDGEAWRVSTVDRWFAWNRNDGRFGRLRDVVVGPDRALYVLTSNHDGRGRPRDGDDRILRLFNVPVGRIR
jgi:quinoprotein glucose dehydrogenase